MKKSKIMPFYKVAFIGPQESGKTSIISQYVNNYFDVRYRPTNGYQEPFMKIMSMNGGKKDGKTGQKNYFALKIQDCIGCDNQMLQGNSKLCKREQFWLKYCLENLKINDMVKDMDKRFRNNKHNKDYYLTEENHLVFPHFYTKKNIYGYIFVINLEHYQAQWELISHFIRFIIKKEHNEDAHITNSKKILIANKRDLLTQPQLHEAKLFLDEKMLEFNENGGTRTLLEPQIHYTSAKNNTGIFDVFQNILDKIQIDNKILEYESQFDAQWQKQKKEGDDSDDSDNDEEKKKDDKSPENKKGFFAMCGCGQMDDDDSEEDEIMKIVNKNKPVDVEYMKQLPLVEGRNQKKDCRVF